MSLKGSRSAWPRPVATYLALVCLLAVACSTPLETVRLAPVGPEWVVGFERDFGSGQGTLVEYVQVDEDIEHWTQRITIQFLEGVRTTPEQTGAALRGQLLANCPTLTWIVLENTPDSFLYEWRTAGCPGQDDQHEVARLLRGNDGMHRVAYTVRCPRMDETRRALWLDRLSAAYVIKGDVMRRVVVEEAGAE